MSLNPKFLNLVIYSNFDMTGSRYFLIRVKKNMGMDFLRANQRGKETWITIEYSNPIV